MNYWLFKSEPAAFSYQDLIRKKKELWDGVRNYQARNFMVEMKTGETGFFYHSSVSEPHIAGILRVSSTAVPDPSQFDPDSHYFDAKASPDKPRWFCVAVEPVQMIDPIITLSELRQHSELQNMTLLQKGSRLSIQKVSPAEFRFILSLRNLNSL